jgi:hypothetical protein
MTQKPAKPAAPGKRAIVVTAGEPAKSATRAKRGIAVTAGEPAKSATRAKRAKAIAAAEPGKRAPAAAAAAPAKPAARRASVSAPGTNRRPPSYDEICERAYFISLEQGGGDEVANWLRAERELATA